MQFPPSLAAAARGGATAQRSQQPPDGSAASTIASPAVTDAAAREVANPLPDAPDKLAIPIAEPVPAPEQGVPVEIHALEQHQQGDTYALIGEVVIIYRSYTLRADKVTYNRSTSEAEATGHLQLEGGLDDEVISATRGTINFDQQTARFFDVLGTVGVRHNPSSRRVVYTTLNPFAFTGRIVIKTGPAAYRIIDGTMTSCRLPKPDWRFFASEIAVENGQARATNSTFRLLRVPVFYLPYVTLPVKTDERQSGLLIPIFSLPSGSRGLTLGESLYWAINRSTDLIVGAEYFSKRGWSPNAEFRTKGAGEDFATIRFKALLDRGAPATRFKPGAPVTHANQGGQDLVINGRHDFDEFTRSVVNIEYLSSYVYRLAFNESFQSAVNSEVKSDAFLMRSKNGWSEDVRFDRYQSYESSNVGDEIRILHLPSVDFEGVDRPLGQRLGPALLYWGFTGSAAGLSRAEPSFSTTREVGRLDLYPHLSLPLHLGDWSFRPELAMRETFYSKSQRPGAGVPIERDATLNRSSFEADFEMRPPVLERVYDSGWLTHATHREFKHTIEPEVQYRYITGVDNFNQVLRFDTTDIASNTNQITYAVTHRLFLKNLDTHPCQEDEAADTGPTAGINAGGSAGGSASPDTESSEGPPADDAQSEAGGTVCEAGAREWMSWQVGQRYYFDPGFGRAVTPGQRNVLESTLDLTGVAFLLRPQNASPVLSRLRVRTTGNTDVEWDLDYNSRAGRIQSSNLFVNFHQGNFFTGLGQSRMVVEKSATSTSVAALTAVYDQVRLLAGFGSPVHRGLNLAANAGYDFTANALQYDGLQAAYNWNCCGVSLEYRRLVLGAVSNSPQYRFNFTLANIGTAGNLRRAERLF